MLELGRKSMGCPVEIEFSVNLSSDKKKKNEFFFLQMRPMVAGGERFEVQITRQEIEEAFCISNQALGHGKNEKIADIVYVKLSSAEDLINKLTERNNKLKGWHKRLMHHTLKLEDQNEEMLEIGQKYIRPKWEAIVARRGKT